MKTGKKTESPYRSINCSFYDLPEADAILGETSVIPYQTPREHPVQTKGIIKNLYI